MNRALVVAAVAALLLAALLIAEAVRCAQHPHATECTAPTTTHPPD